MSYSWKKNEIFPVIQFQAKNIQLPVTSHKQNSNFLKTLSLSEVTQLNNDCNWNSQEHNPVCKFLIEENEVYFQNCQPSVQSMPSKIEINEFSDVTNSDSETSSYLYDIQSIFFHNVGSHSEKENNFIFELNNTDLAHQQKTCPEIGKIYEYIAKDRPDSLKINFSEKMYRDLHFFFITKEGILVR